MNGASCRRSGDLTAFTIVVLSTLEDPSGNRINQPFEVESSDPKQASKQPDRFTMPVRIARDAGR